MTFWGVDMLKLLQDKAYVLTSFGSFYFSKAVSQQN